MESTQGVGRVVCHDEWVAAVAYTLTADSLDKSEAKQYQIELQAQGLVPFIPFCDALLLQTADHHVYRIELDYAGGSQGIYRGTCAELH